MIRIITRPTVAVIGRTQFDRPALQPYLDAIGSPGWQSDAATGGDAIAEVGGRLCYQSFGSPRPGGNQAYLDRIKSEGHGSVLEHASWSLLITGVSRTLTHEMVRHRAGFAYSQRSQRYCDDATIGFVMPPILSDVWEETGGRDHPQIQAWIESCKAAVATYQDLTDSLESASGLPLSATTQRKAIRSAARSVLPGCTATEILVTANARAWRHFLDLRGSIHADAEIRRLAIAILAVLKVESPEIYGDYIVCPNRGVVCIDGLYRRV